MWFSLLKLAYFFFYFGRKYVWTFNCNSLYAWPSGTGSYGTSPSESVFFIFTILQAHEGFKECLDSAQYLLYYFWFIRWAGVYFCIRSLQWWSSLRGVIFCGGALFSGALEGGDLFGWAIFTMTLFGGGLLGERWEGWAWLVSSAVVHRITHLGRGS